MKLDNKELHYTYDFGSEKQAVEQDVNLETRDHKRGPGGQAAPKKDVYKTGNANQPRPPQPKK